MIGGVAAIIAAAVAFGGLEAGDPRARRTAPPAVVPVTEAASQPSRLLVYIVGAEAEKRALELDVAASSGWLVETYAGMDTEVRILVLGRSEEESLEALARLVPEASLATGVGPALKLVDMR